MQRHLTHRHFAAPRFADEAKGGEILVSSLLRELTESPRASPSAMHERWS